MVVDNDANAGRTTERIDREWQSWALEFAQADLKSWQEQDWRNALAEAMAFGASHDESAHAQLPLTMLGPRNNLKLSLEQIETALRSAHKALRRFIRDLEQSIHVPLMNAEIPFKGTCVFFLWSGHPEVRYLRRRRRLRNNSSSKCSSERVNFSCEATCPSSGDAHDVSDGSWRRATDGSTPRNAACGTVYDFSTEEGRRGDLSLLASPSGVTRATAILRSSNDALAAEGTLACAGPAAYPPTKS